MNTSPEYAAKRRWLGWLLVACMASVVAARAFGFLPEATVEAAPLPVTPAPQLTPMPASPTPAAPTPAPAFNTPVLLTDCGQPQHIGLRRPGAAPCEFIALWTLADFAAQLVPLNLLAADETLAAPPHTVDPRCPLTVMRGNTAAGARLCFTPQGSIYRDTGRPTDADWAWQPTGAGQWVLAQPVKLAGR